MAEERISPSVARMVAEVPTEAILLKDGGILRRWSVEVSKGGFVYYTGRHFTKRRAKDAIFTQVTKLENLLASLGAAG